MASPPPKKVLFPIADGTEPMEAILPIDTLRRSGADVTIASVEDRPLVHAMYGINIVADALLPDCAALDYDLIALPGGVPGSYTLRDCGLLETKVKSQAAEGKLYAAICAAPAVALGSWGLLKGLKATCTPLWMDQMPADAVVVESRVVVDGQVVTSRGSGTAIEFGLALIEQLYGKEKADEVAEPMLIRPEQGVEFHVKELNSIEWKHNNPPQDKKATAYPEVCCKLTDQSECENRVVVDGNLITSRGPGTTMEFALAIVEKLYGREAALEHAKSMVFIDP